MRVATREWNGLEVPAPGRWRIDEQASELAFVARYLRVMQLRMRFRRFEGTIDVAEDPAETRLEARVRTGSIDTGIGVLDRMIRAPRILDAERYPELGYAGTRVEVGEGARLRLHGELTVREVTRAVPLEVEYLGASEGRAGFRARAEIAHEEFLHWKQLLGIRGWLVGPRVRIELSIVASPEA